LTLSQKIQKLSATFNKPFFLRKDQSLSLNADIGREDSDAYLQTGLNTGAAIKRGFTRHLSGTTGIDINIVRIEDKSTEERDNEKSYALVSLPQTLTYDNRDNPLDATKGWLLEGTVAPYFDAFGQSSPFWKTTGAARTYIPIASRTTLALRAKLGSILGPSTVNIPATERFYSGGGGSVRGFDYQGIGPMKDGQPVGGRSLAEASAELRFKLTDTIGAVAFLDMGSVGTAVVPTFSNMAVGAGAGLRYYTGFGPLRLDVGVPVSGKNESGSQYGLYISIGQAF
jgi:translocation and assembly module TamA